MTLLEYLNKNDIWAAEGGMALTEISEGSATARMTVQRRHLNGAGTCQGGALFTLADLAVAAVMNSHGNITVGLENSITFHRPAFEGDELRAVATETVNHKKIPFCRVEIYNGDGTLIASGTSMGYRKADSFDYSSLM